MESERANRPDIITQPERGRAVALTKVRTTITPGKVIEVDERELLDLKRQGLIYSPKGDKSAEPDDDNDSDEPDKPRKVGK